MIRYYRHSEIDKSRWDNCIKASPAGIAYAASWYLDLVSPGWEALIEDDYAAVFPLTSRRKYGFNYLFQPFFTQQGGLFKQDEFIHAEKTKLFLESIPSKFKLIEINLNTSNQIEILKKTARTPENLQRRNLSDFVKFLTPSNKEELLIAIKKQIFNVESAIKTYQTDEYYSKMLARAKEALYEFEQNDH